MAGRLRTILGGSVAALILLTGCTSADTSPNEAAVSIGELVPDPTPRPSATPVPTANPSPTATPQPTAEPAATPTSEEAAGTAANTAIVSLNGNRVASLTEALDRATDGDEVEIGPGELFTPGIHVVTVQVLITGAGPDLTTVSSTDDSTLFSLQGNGITLRNMTVTTAYKLESADELAYDVIEVAGATSFLITNVTATESLRSGIGTFEDSQGVIADVVITDNVESGIALTDDSFVQIFNASVSGNGADGVWWSGNANGLASAVASAVNGAHGFAATGNAEPTLRATSAERNELSGYVWFDESGGESIGSIAEDNFGNGFSVRNSASPRIQGNLAANNTEFGFAWQEDASGIALTNVARGNEFSGFGASGRATPLIIGNRAVDNGEAGFAWFDSSAGEARANVTEGSNDFSFHLSGEATPTWGLNSLDVDPVIEPGTSVLQEGDGVRSIMVEAGAGVTSDGQTLAGALGEASDGDVLHLSEGTHSIPERLVVDKQVSILGPGSGLTRLVVTNDATAFDVTADMVTLAGITIAPENAVATDGDLSAVVRASGIIFLINDVRVVDAETTGFRIIESAAGSIMNSEVQGSPETGLVVSGNSSVDLYRFWANESADTGVLYSGAATGIVASSVASVSGGLGFSFGGTTSAYVVATLSVDSGDNAYMWFADSTGVAVSNHALRGNGTGFAAEQRTSVAWRGNRAEDVEGQDVSFGPDTDVIVDD